MFLTFYIKNQKTIASQYSRWGFLIIRLYKNLVILWFRRGGNRTGWIRIEILRICSIFFKSEYSSGLIIFYGKIVINASLKIKITDNMGNK